MDLPNKDWLSVAEVAEYLGVDRRTIYDLVHIGTIPVLHLNGERFSPYRISKHDLVLQPLAEVSA